MIVEYNGKQWFRKPLQKYKQHLNTDIGKPIEANQVCIKKPEPDTQVKISKLFNDKRSMLADIRQQVGIL